MKCFFCNAEMLDGKDKCDYCGNYQHDYKNNDIINNSDINQKKSSKSKIFIRLIESLIFIAIIVYGAFMLLKYLDNQKTFFGNWNCPDGDFYVVIDSSNFKMKFSSSVVETANYIIEEEKQSEDDVKTYFINVSASKTLNNGSTQTNKNNTKFQIIIDEKQSGTLQLKNLVTDTEYKCYRQKD